MVWQRLPHIHVGLSFVQHILGVPDPRLVNTTGGGPICRASCLAISKLNVLVRFKISANPLICTQCANKLDANCFIAYI